MYICSCKKESLTDFLLQVQQSVTTSSLCPRNGHCTWLVTQQLTSYVCMYLQTYTVQRNLSCTYVCKFKKQCKASDSSSS